MSIDITLSWSDQLLLAATQVAGEKERLQAHVQRYALPATQEASGYLDEQAKLIEALDLALRQILATASSALETESDNDRDPEADPLPRTALGEALDEGYALYRRLELGID